jgi:hypothetical protein
MHRTETVDYVIVIDGEIEMDMDDSTVKLKPATSWCKRGTNHAWANRSGKNARVAFVLVDAKPLGIGKPVLGTHSAAEYEETAMTDHSRRACGDACPHAGSPRQQARRPIRTAGPADRADLARRRDRHHGAHRRAAADGILRPDRRRRQPRRAATARSAPSRWRTRRPTG